MQIKHSCYWLQHQQTSISGIEVAAPVLRSYSDALVQASRDSKYLYQNKIMKAILID